MVTGEHSSSLLRRSIPLLPQGLPSHPAPPPYLARHLILPTTCHPTLQACLPRQPCQPPQPRRRRKHCDALVQSSSSCKGCVCGVHVYVHPLPIFYTPHLKFYKTPLKFYVPPQKFYVPHLIFYVPPPI